LVVVHARTECKRAYLGGDPTGAAAEWQAEDGGGAREGGGPLTSRVWEVAGGGGVEGGEGGSHGGEAGARASRSRHWWPLKMKETKGYLFVALIAEELPRPTTTSETSNLWLPASVPPWHS